MRDMSSIFAWALLGSGNSCGEEGYQSYPAYNAALERQREREREREGRRDGRTDRQTERERERERKRERDVHFIVKPTS